LAQAKSGNLAQAVELFRQAVQADPRNGLAWNNLGLALRKQGRTQDAVGAYFKAIEVQPDLALAYKNLGLSLESLGYKAGAAMILRKYCALNPSAPDVASVRDKAARLEQAAAATGGGK
jgi:superkiller protein 3